MKILRLALLVVALMVITSCASDEAPAQTTPAQQGATQQPGQAAAAGQDGPLIGWASNTTPVDLSLFLNGSWWIGGNWGNDPSSQRLIEATGVNFSVQLPVTADDTMLNLMIASDDLPDVIITGWTSPAWREMINNDQLADWDVLIDTYAPDLRQNVGEDIFEISRIDGRLFRVNNFVEGVNFQETALRYDGIIGSNQPVILVRQDFFSEIGSPEIRNASEFMEAVALMHANHPDRIGFYGGNMFINNIGPLAMHFGVPPWYEQGDRLVHNWRHPAYRDALLFMHQMAARGLITREVFVDDSTVARGKVDQGLPITYHWTLGETGQIPADNPNTTYMPMPPWDTYRQYRSGAGWMAVGISSRSQHQDRAIKFFDYTNSMEGAGAIWGVQGEWAGDPIAGPHWHMVNGRPTYHQEFFTARLADWEGIERSTGIGTYSQFIFCNGLVNLPSWIPGDTFMEEQNALFGDRVFYRPDLLTIVIPGGSDYDVIRVRVADLLREAVAEFTFAPSEEAAWAIWDQFIERAESVGALELEEFMTANWQR